MLLTLSCCLTLAAKSGTSFVNIMFIGMSRSTSSLFTRALLSIPNEYGISHKVAYKLFYIDYWIRTCRIQRSYTAVLLLLCGYSWLCVSEKIENKHASLLQAIIILTDKYVVVVLLPSYILITQLIVRMSCGKWKGLHGEGIVARDRGSV